MHPEAFHASRCPLALVRSGSTSGRPSGCDQIAPTREPPVRPFPVADGIGEQQEFSTSLRSGATPRVNFSDSSCVVGWAYEPLPSLVAPPSDSLRQDYRDSAAHQLNEHPKMGPPSDLGGTPPAVREGLPPGYPPGTPPRRSAPLPAVSRAGGPKGAFKIFSPLRIPVI